VTAKKQTKAPSECVVEHCDRAVEHPRSGLCKRCYSGMYYWSRKSVTEIVKRQQKLRVFMDRMKMMGGE